MLKYIIIICLFLNGCTTYKQNKLEKQIIKKQQSWLNIQYLAMKKPQLTNKKGTMKKYNYIQVHTLTYMKTDEDGNDDGKIYEYDGDYSSYCDGILPDELIEINKKEL